MRILTISKESPTSFLVDDRLLLGTPPVGRGKTMFEAIGNWLHHNRELVGIEFEVDASAQPAEDRRQQRELRKR